MNSGDDVHSDIDLTSTLSLVRGAQGGDRESLEELFSRYAPRVRRIVALRLGMRVRDLATQEDILQDALLRAFTALESFEQESVGAFRNWLSRCVESAIVDRARRRTAQKRGAGRERSFSEQGIEALTTSIFAGGDPTPSAVAEQRDLEERIESALLDMDARYREVIVLHNLCGLTHAEIAERLGVGDVATARQIHSRAMRKLKQRMGT